MISSQPILTSQLVREVAAVMPVRGGKPNATIGVWIHSLTTPVHFRFETVACSVDGVAAGLPGGK
jgi:hypothetical protein